MIMIESRTDSGTGVATKWGGDVRGSRYDAGQPTVARALALWQRYPLSLYRIATRPTVVTPSMTNIYLRTGFDGVGAEDEAVMIVLDGCVKH